MTGVPAGHPTPDAPVPPVTSNSNFGLPTFPQPIPDRRGTASMGSRATSFMILARGSPRDVSVLGMIPRGDLKSGDGEIGPWDACCRSVTTDTTEPNTPDIPIRECFIDEEKIPNTMHVYCVLAWCFHKQPTSAAEISDFLIRCGHSRTDKYQSIIIRVCQFLDSGGTRLDAMSRTYG